MLHHEDMDTESLRAPVLAAYEEGPTAVVALVVTLMSGVAAQLETVATRVTVLEGENATLRTENAALRAKLETNSRNSGKPPSSDEPGVTPHPKSQRVRSGRPPGGQMGHAGHSLPFVAEPDAVQEHAPAQCAGCGQSLVGVPVQRWERRQVVDIPPVRARVIEHRVATACCPGCGRETSGAFPPDVAAPVQYGPGVATLAVYLTQEQLLPLGRTAAVLAEVFGCSVTEGTVERAVADCHERLAGVEEAIKRGVTAAAVAHQRRDRGEHQRDDRLVARGEHATADVLCRPRQARARGDGRDRRAAAVSGAGHPRRVDQLLAVRPVDARAVQRSSSA